MRIGSLEIGQGHPCAIISELSNNWRTVDTPEVPGDADRDRMGRLIDAAKAAGASAIKTQCYDPREIVALRGNGPAPEPWGSQGWDMEALYRHAATPFDWFPKIKAHCERIGIPWFSSVFGPESLALLESLDCPAYKIAALDNRSEGLVRAVAAMGKPMVVSARGPHERFFVYAVGGVVECYCPPGYPTSPEAVRLPLTFGGYCGQDGWEEEAMIGLSSHCLAPELPIAAVARGCSLIEMHMHLAEEPSALEANVSLTQHEFRRMVDSVRATEVLLGHS